MAEDVRSASRDLSALRIRRDENRPRPGRTWIVGVAVLLALGGAFFLWRAATAGSRLPEVEVGMVRLSGSGDAGGILSAAGYILPDRKADVSARAFGQLEWVGIEVGSQVKEGQILARLANADVAAQVEQAKIEVKDAEREFARWKKIVEDGLEPKERLDKVETAFLTSRARLKQAEAAFEYTLIRAPFDGVVVRRIAQAGETIGPSGAAGSGVVGGSLCTIIDRASLEMVADVNETNIGKVKAGQKAEVAADARPERKYLGQVRQIVPTADRQKGIVQVKVKLLDADDLLLPEMAARATFLRDGAEAGAPRKVIAPKGSVREQGGRKVVFVLEKDAVRAAAVETGAEGEDGVEIRTGLLGGERAVTGGASVSDGDRVRVRSKN